MTGARTHTNHADELLTELRLTANILQHTPSETIAADCCRRVADLALELDRWVTQGNAAPSDWRAALHRPAAGGCPLSVPTV